MINLEVKLTIIPAEDGNSKTGYQTHSLSLPISLPSYEYNILTISREVKETGSY
jgi:hypothetical protein